MIAIIFSSCTQPKWTKYSIKGSRVIGLFPVKPIQTSSKLRVPGKGKAQLDYVSLNKDNIFYAISVLKAKDEEMIFNIDDMSPRSLLRKGAKLIRVRSIQVNGVEGKEFLLKYSGRKIKQRMFVDSNKIYTIVVIYTQQDRRMAKKFLRSVRFKDRKFLN